MTEVSSFSDYASGLGTSLGGGRDTEGLNMTGGGVILKQHPLMDMSRPQKDTRTTFDDYVQQFKRFKNGVRIKGVKVNTGFNNANKPVTVVGRLKEIKIDRPTKTVRIFIFDPATSKEIEIYADTVESVNESYVKTLDEFVVID